VGQELEPFSLDLMAAAPTALPDGEGVTGSFRSGTFSFAATVGRAGRGHAGGAVVLLEGVAVKGAETINFRATADLADVQANARDAQIIGSTFQEVQVAGDGLVTATVHPRPGSCWSTSPACRPERPRRHDAGAGDDATYRVRARPRADRRLFVRVHASRNHPVKQPPHMRSKISGCIVAACVCLIAGCDDAGSGAATFTTWGEAYIEDEIPAAEVIDGWTIRYDKFLVAFHGVEVANTRGEVAATMSGSRLVDNAQPGRKLLVSFDGLAAEAWDAVSYQIKPPVADTRLVSATRRRPRHDDGRRPVDLRRRLGDESRDHQDLPLGLPDRDAIQ
jgi:hypothetical protein